MGIQAHHFVTRPAPELLQDVRRGAVLDMPARPRMPQVVEAERLDLRRLHCQPPLLPEVAVLRRHRPALVGEHEVLVIALQGLQYPHRVGAERHRDRLLALAPDKKRRVPKSAEEHTNLAIRVGDYKVKSRASINHYAYDPQYAWRDTEEDPLYEFETGLEVIGTGTYPDERKGDTYEITVRRAEHGIENILEAERCAASG